MFQDFDAKVQHRVGAAADRAVDHGLPPECARLRGVDFRTPFEVFRQPLGDPPARMEPMARATPAGFKGRVGEAACFSTRQSSMDAGT